MYRLLSAGGVWLRAHAWQLVAAVLTIALIPHTGTAFTMLLLGTAASDARSLNQILKEIDEVEAKHKGKVMPEDEGGKLDALYLEGKSFQDAADRKKKNDALHTFAREIPDPALPDAKQQKEDLKKVRNAIAGYMTLGDFIAASPQFKAYTEGGFTQHSMSLAVPFLLKIRGLPGVKQGFVPLGKELREKIEALQMETKDLPTLGSRVIEPDRLSDIVMDVENDQLAMRDVLNISPTTSNLIEWVGRTAFTRAADIQSEGPTAATMEDKPDADTNYTLRSTPVRTIAVWIPVTEQQLQDAPALVNLIQQDLLYDVRKKEEEQVVWGAGSGSDLDGLNNNVTEVTAGSLTSNIDLIRRAITEIRVSGYSPNAVTIHPEEWEGIELEKGSDGHYIWAVIRDVLGARIWGLRVIETVAMDEVGGGDHLIIPGDYRRGATLYDRMQASIAIGWQDKQFIENIRTVRAEERVAFAVRRPDAFRKITISA